MVAIYPSRWLALISFVAIANGGQVQVPNLQVPSKYSAYQQAVVNLFSVSYTAYKSVFFRVQITMLWFSLVPQQNCMGS